MEKPLLRGHIHQEFFFFALGACSMLLAKATTKVSFLSALTYSGTLILLLGVSALYHRPNWSPQKRAFMRKLDHSAIFLLIIGSFTPVCILALPPEIGNKLLLAVSIAVLFGVLKCFFWTDAPKWLSCVLYGVVSSFFVPYVSEFYAALGIKNMIFVWTGNIIYSIGGTFYALKKPDPFPGVFGHHELFHLFTVIGFLLHFAVIYSLIH